MKKFIVLILVLAIVGGVAYFFFSNSMAMTAMISQSTDKVMVMHNKAYNKSSNYKGYDLTLHYKENDGDGVDKLLYAADIKIAKADESMNIKAVVTDKTGDNEVSYTYYFKDDVLYTLKGETKTKESMTLNNALNKITGGYILLNNLWNYESAKYTEADFEQFHSCSITARFNPLYIGCKNTWKFVPETEGEPTVTYAERIDAGCTLREVSAITSTEALTMKTYLTVNKPGKKVSVTFPDLSEYTSSDLIDLEVA